MIERAPDRFVAVSGGKVSPPPTNRGNLLPLDRDSSFKRIAYVITNHAFRRRAHSAGSESSLSWPRPWP
jgi:hypothetical protein